MRVIICLLLLLLLSNNWNYVYWFTYILEHISLCKLDLVNTLTFYSYIFIVTTVMGLSGGALEEARLIASTSDFIHPDTPRSLTPAVFWSLILLSSIEISKLTTCHLQILWWMVITVQLCHRKVFTGSTRWPLSNFGADWKNRQHAWSHLKHSH